MMQSFPELTIGGILVAPFVLYAGVALVLYLALRPVLALLAFDRAFANPPLAQLCVYVVVLALLMVFL